MKPAARHKARSYALQALYEWLISDNDVAVIESRFLAEYDFKKTDVEYFSELLNGVVSKSSELDEKMTPYLDRSLKELNPVELSLLRMAIYELVYRPDVPYQVVINEAIELTKKFGAQDGHKYVNGVLDQIAKSLHPKK